MINRCPNCILFPAGPLPPSLQETHFHSRDRHGPRNKRFLADLIRIRIAVMRIALALVPGHRGALPSHNGSERGARTSAVLAWPSELGWLSAYSVAVRPTLPWTTRERESTEGRGKCTVARAEQKLSPSQAWLASKKHDIPGNRACGLRPLPWFPKIPQGFDKKYMRNALSDIYVIGTRRRGAAANWERTAATVMSRNEGAVMGGGEGGWG